MNALYGHAHAQLHLSAQAPGEEDSLPKPFLNLVQNVFNGDIKTGDIDTPTALHMAENFMGAIYEGYGKTFAEVDYNTPDFKMLRNLEASVYHFSSAKSWQINKSLTVLLKDGDKVRSFTQFQKAAQKELNVYVGKYARVEYNSAISSSHMTAIEQRIQEKAHIMPWVKFSTTESERVCPICGPYDGMIRRYDDPVWNHASPLLHFQCQCTKLQLPGSRYTPTPDKDLPDPEMIPKMFRTNYAAKGQAFPPDHAYYDGPKKLSLNKWVNKNLPDREPS